MFQVINLIWLYLVMWSISAERIHDFIYKFDNIIIILVIWRPPSFFRKKIAKAFFCKILFNKMKKVCFIIFQLKIIIESTSLEISPFEIMLKRDQSFHYLSFKILLKKYSKYSYITLIILVLLFYFWLVLWKY